MQLAARSSQLGTLFGVGVGPGDPGLVTVRAVAVIRAAPVVAFPVHRKGGASRALDTVRQHLNEETKKLPLLLPMTRDRNRLEQAHSEAARLLAEAGRGGDIACLSLGDPLFYSTFGYLACRYPGPVEIICGVPAMSAAAAAIGLPLASGDTPTAVVTGADVEGLAAALGMNASLVILKPRALPPAAFDLLDRFGAWGRASAAIELGGASQKIIRELDRAAAETLPYFAVVWIQPKKRMLD